MLGNFEVVTLMKRILWIIEDQSDSELVLKRNEIYCW